MLNKIFCTKKSKPKSSTIGHGPSHEKIHLTKCCEMITQFFFHGLFCNSQRSAKSNTLAKLKTKKNTASELKFGCKTNCVHFSEWP